MVIRRCWVAEKRIRRDVAVRARLVHACTRIGKTTAGNDVIEPEYRRVRIVSSTDNRVLVIKRNQNVVNHLGLGIEPVGENSGALSAVVLRDRVVVEKWSALSRRHEPINTTAGSRTVARNQVLDDERIGIVNDPYAATLRIGSVVRDEVVFHDRR